MFGSYCKYLGCVVSGGDCPEPASRGFVDILARARMPPELSKPIVPDDLLPSPEGTQGGDWDGVRHIHTELSEELTARLLNTCDD